MEVIRKKYNLKLQKPEDNLNGNTSLNDLEDFAYHRYADERSATQRRCHKEQKAGITKNSGHTQQAMIAAQKLSP